MLKVHKRDMNQIRTDLRLHHLFARLACLGICSRSWLCWFSDPPSDVPSLSSVPFISPTAVSADSSKRSCRSVTSLKEMNGSWKCFTHHTKPLPPFCQFPKHLPKKSCNFLFLLHTVIKVIMPCVSASQKNVMVLIKVSFILIEMLCAMFWKDDVVYC